MKKLLKKLICLLLSCIFLSACKNKVYKETECYNCNKIKNCYKVTFVSDYFDGEEDYWFCSDSCDKIVTDRLIRSGCHIKK